MVLGWVHFTTIKNQQAAISTLTRNEVDVFLILKKCAFFLLLPL